MMQKSSSRILNQHFFTLAFNKSSIRFGSMSLAAKNISQEIRDNYSDIPWKRMAGMRDVLIHQYHGIDLEVVWQTISQELTEVGQRIEQIIEDIEG